MPNTIELISIGIVCEDGREYYNIANWYTYEHASDWVKENVIKPIHKVMFDGHEKVPDISVFHHQFGQSVRDMKNQILGFVGKDPEFWGYYADYDWVAFCWIFGRMLDLPMSWPKYCRDLKQLADDVGKPKFDKPTQTHNALDDALWNKKFHEYLLIKE
jgi:hypothetical protein